MNRNSAWSALGLGALLLVGEIPPLIAGQDGAFWGVSIPLWVEWVLFILSIILLGIGIWGLLSKPAPPPNINTEAAEAKAKMDQMYFDEYGTWPDYKDDLAQPAENPKDHERNKAKHL